MELVTVRYWAGLRAAAGVAEDQVLAGPVSAVLDAVRARHDERFAAALERCSLLLDGTQVHDPSSRAEPGALLDCLPPFAGG